MLSWLGAHWTAILSDTGVIAGLFYTGHGSWKAARALRAQTSMEMTKHHYALWSDIGDRPELDQMFDQDRDLDARPLTAKES